MTISGNLVGKILREAIAEAEGVAERVLPAALGIGPGAESRGPMAVATAAGMLSSRLLTLLVVPVFYLLFDAAADLLRRGLRRLVGGTAPQARDAA